MSPATMPATNNLMLMVQSSNFLAPGGAVRESPWKAPPAGVGRLRRTLAREPHFPRTASFNPPTALRIFPLTLSALPSALSFLSPVTFPATSFTLPLACSAEPLMRSLSMASLQYVLRKRAACLEVPSARPLPCASGSDQFSQSQPCPLPAPVDAAKRRGVELCGWNRRLHLEIRRLQRHENVPRGNKRVLCASRVPLPEHERERKWGAEPDRKIPKRRYSSRHCAR